MRHRFHINFGDHRTTITVDGILVAMLALKLGRRPDSSQGRRAVREWLQARLPDKAGEGRGRKDASQGARELIIETIAARKVAKQYSDWIIEQNQPFAERLRDVREDAGLDEEQVAEWAEVTLARYREWESGESAPDSTTQTKLLDFLSWRN